MCKQSHLASLLAYTMIRSVVLLVVCMLCVYHVHAESRGFGDSISWVNSLDDAKALSAEQGKPVFLLIHKSWCGACKRLKGVFADSDTIAEKAKQFIMVNLEDDEEPEGAQFKPDGGYIPRIFFLNKEGEVDAGIKAPAGNAKYAYYYSSEEQVLKGMDAALEAFTA